MATNPMHQFHVYRIGPEINMAGVDLSFTNASLFMLISAILISILLLFSTREKKINSKQDSADIGNAIQFYCKDD